MQSKNIEESSAPVSSTVNDSWKIELINVRGECTIKVDTSVPWRPKQSKIALYEGPPPADPTQWKSVNWWVAGDPQWDTNQLWGPGWSAALIAMDGNSSEGGSYHYVVKTGVTS